ncbi:RHS repeat domain-containing protein, partial [Streptomyces omiyaensis]
LFRIGLRHSDILPTCPTGQARSDATRSCGRPHSKDSRVGLLVSDHHNTNTLSISASSLATNRRKTMPFGGERGAAPYFWPGTKGFVGGDIDTTTGLTHIGAREYDTALGQFISVDPILSLDQAQSLNGYSYANNNSVTTSDPTGMRADDARCGGTNGANRCGSASNGTKATGAVPGDVQQPSEGGDYIGETVAGNAGEDQKTKEEVDRERKRNREREVLRLEDEYLDRQTAPLCCNDDDGADNGPYFWQKPNQAEMNMCLLSLAECSTAYAIAGWAEETAGKYWRKIGLRKGGQNALQHFLWQARLTVELGEEGATRLADAHEAYLDIRERGDRMADLYNNPKTIEVGRKPLESTWSEPFPGIAQNNITEGEIVDAVDAYLSTGDYAVKANFGTYENRKF